MPAMARCSATTGTPRRGPRAISSPPTPSGARLDCARHEGPVLFEAPEASDLIGFFVAAVSGGSLYRKSTFLPDSLGTEVFAPHVSIREEPHLLRARGSAPFDNEGVATTPRDLVR